MNNLSEITALKSYWISHLSSLLSGNFKSFIHYFETITSRKTSLGISANSEKLVHLVILVLLPIQICCKPNVIHGNVSTKVTILSYFSSFVPISFIQQNILKKLFIFYYRFFMREVLSGKYAHIFISLSFTSFFNIKNVIKKIFFSCLENFFLVKFIVL